MRGSLRASADPCMHPGKSLHVASPNRNHPKSTKISNFEEKNKIVLFLRALGTFHQNFISKQFLVFLEILFLWTLITNSELRCTKGSADARKDPHLWIFGTKIEDDEDAQKDPRFFVRFKRTKWIPIEILLYKNRIKRIRQIIYYESRGEGIEYRAWQFIPLA